MTKLRLRIKELNAELQETGDWMAFKRASLELIEVQAELIQKLQLAIIKHA